SASTSELLDAAAGLLGRPGAEIGAERARDAALESVLLARGDRLRSLLVERRRDACRATPVGEARDDERPALLGARDLDRLADPHVPRRLDPFAADVDVAAEHGLRRGAAGLEEPRGPEPLVDPHLFHGVIRNVTSARGSGVPKILQRKRMNELT